MVRQAMNDLLTCSWESPYLKYIHKLRVELGLFELPLREMNLKKFISDYFVNIINGQIEALPLAYG